MDTKITVRDIVITGLLAAICVIATMIKVPYGAGAMVHLGTAAIYTSAILFGGKKAGIAAAIGSALFDIISGYMVYTVWSIVIKGIAGFVVGTIANSGGAEGRNIVKNIIACLIGAAWTLAGYIVAWAYVQGSIQTAIGNIPSSLMTSAAGFIIGLPLATALKKTMKNYKF